MIKAKIDDAYDLRRCYDSLIVMVFLCLYDIVK